jgi:hypothetical protein
MAAKWKRIMEEDDIAQELFLTVTWTHMPQKMNFHPMKVTVTKKRQTAQWSDSTQSVYGVPVIHRFTGGPSGTRQNEDHTIHPD